LKTEHLTLPEISEEIVKNHLRELGYITYSPDNKNQAHCFDFVCTLNKERIFYADVKFKTSSIFVKGTFGQLHGINSISFEEYKRYKRLTSSPFHLIFVDIQEGVVYTQEINKLTGAVYIKNGEIICWPVAGMKKMFILSEKELEQLKNPVKK
jgi:hypothetical protein